MKIREYTEKLSFEEIQEIFKNFKEFEENGIIGDCLLRFFTNKIVKDIGIERPPIVIWMNLVAGSCYRIIAEKAMEEGFKF